MQACVENSNISPAGYYDHLQQPARRDILGGARRRLAIQFRRGQRRTTARGPSTTSSTSFAITRSSYVKCSQQAKSCGRCSSGRSTRIPRWCPTSCASSPDASSTTERMSSPSTRSESVPTAEEQRKMSISKNRSISVPNARMHTRCSIGKKSDGSGSHHRHRSLLSTA